MIKPDHRPTTENEERRHLMTETRVPWWLFAIIAVGALLASGIYLGIMSAEGFAGLHLVQAVGFGLLGLIMFWAATHRQ
jgi:hypothetical protein